MQEGSTQSDAWKARPAERPGGVRGLWVVLGTLSLFVVVPAISVGVWMMVRDDAVAPSEMVWAERHAWFKQMAKPRPLEYDTFVAGETGRQYRKTNLILGSVDEAMLQHLSALARREDFATSADIREELASASADFPDQWYPPYLLASWYGFHGDEQAYDHWMTEAFGRADGAIVQRLVDGGGDPAVGYRLPPVAIGYDRVVDGKRNATLVLVYPAPVSDEQGYVYLPAYWTLYRLTDPQAPPGVEPPRHPRGLTLLPQPMDGSVPNWFSVPPPGIAQLPDAVVEENPQP